MATSKSSFFQMKLENLLLDFKFQIGYAKYMATTTFAHVSAISKELVHICLFFWLLFSTKYTVLYSSNAAYLTFQAQTLQIESQD